VHPPPREDLSSLKCPELRALCRERRLLSTGKKAALLERLGCPEELRGPAAEDTAARVSPGKESREEEPFSPDHKSAIDSGEDISTAVEEIDGKQEEHWPPWDAYRLMLDCDKDEHTEDCCDMPEGLDPAPSPMPARVFHPYLNITGDHDPNYHDMLQPDRTSYVAFYKFVKDGKVFHMECFEYV
jgi:hypothetical protein